MASQQQSGRAASKARRQLQVNGKGRSPAASAPTRQPKIREHKPVPVANLTSAPEAAAPSFTAPVNMPKPRPAQKSASRLRREALAARGKRADRSSDRQRNNEMALQRRSAAEAKSSNGKCGCGGACCKEAEAAAVAATSMVTAYAVDVPASSNNGVKAKIKPVVNASSAVRLFSRARRAAMADRGKAGLVAHGKGNSSASLARRANPEISARDLARVVRDTRSKCGARGSVTAAPAQTARRPRNAAEAMQVSGTKVSHSTKTTGDETGLCRSVTGTDYFSSDVFTEFCQSEAPKVPQKVGTTTNLSGKVITASGKVGRSEAVTGDERGSCRNVTGVEYVGREQYDDFCKSKPEPGVAKVSFSQTTRGQIVSGSKPARSEHVTGDERGTCKAVTGTPYTGVEQYTKYCEPTDSKMAMARNQRNMGSNVGRDITGVQPGFAGLTGAAKGACRDVSGTNYIGAAQFEEVCGLSPAKIGEPDFPKPMGGAPWGNFSVISPVHASQEVSKQDLNHVTGTRYEKGRISGTFSLGEGKITGTEQFRFGSEKVNTAERATAPMRPMAALMGAAKAKSKADAEQTLKSRVTGEGLDIAMTITGDDWDRGEHVTGTEGRSAAKRNPTRRGPVSAMPTFDPKRNDEVATRSDISVTGGSGNTDKGAPITVSGGARG